MRNATAAPVMRLIRKHTRLLDEEGRSLGFDDAVAYALAE